MPNERRITKTEVFPYPRSIAELRTVNRASLPEWKRAGLKEKTLDFREVGQDIRRHAYNRRQSLLEVFKQLVKENTQLNVQTDRTDKLTPTEVYELALHVAHNGHGGSGPNAILFLYNAFEMTPENILQLMPQFLVNVNFRDSSNAICLIIAEELMGLPYGTLYLLYRNDL